MMYAISLITGAIYNINYDKYINQNFPSLAMPCLQLHGRLHYRFYACLTAIHVFAKGSTLNVVLCLLHVQVGVKFNLSYPEMYLQPQTFDLVGLHRL